jgi:hypothetical protein
LRVAERSTRNKSLFASFSSEKEGLFFFEKRTKKLLLLALHCLGRLILERAARSGA